MARNIARKLSFGFTFLLLAASSGRAFAQPDDPCLTDPTIPCVVTGTSPEPQVVTGTSPEPQVVTGTSPEPQMVVGDLSLLELLAVS